MFKFKGGIHVPENKITEQSSIIDGPYPKKVIIPLQQHIGAPCKPIVNTGDSVKTGQKIGESMGFVSVPVHSSVTGIVKQIKEHFTPLGIPSSSVVIEAQESDEWIKPEKDYIDFFRFDPEELINVIKENGIVGLGGAAFPTHVKLSPPANKPIDTVIVNGAECEPYLTNDYRVMIEYARDIIDGLNIVMHILKTDRGIICIEDNKPQAIQVIKEEVAKQPNMELMILKTYYPQGSEKQMIYAVTKREVPPDGLPMDVGCVVQNVGTLYAIKHAVYTGKPLIERIITVTGHNISKPSNLLVRIGTSIRDILEFCGWNGKAGKIISGGPMMGIAQRSVDVPVIKSTGGILILDEKAVGEWITKECIRCGKCIEVCPMNLMPVMIYTYAEKRMWKKLKKYNVADCMECGCCTYSCPAKLPIVQSVKWAKVEIRKKNNT
ncbi:electron transport complex subunit RsxC [bacterium]